MKVSIIIPCYQQSQYLSEAIESALNQTYQDIEVIVINDGSPDSTKEVASYYPVKLVNQTNRGLSAARNTGIMNATGDYILPLDADDKLLLSCVEKIVAVAEKTDADVIAPSFQNFGLDHRAVILMQNPRIENFKIGNRIGYFSAIKRSVLLEVGGYSSKMVWGYEDYALWFDLLSRGRTIVTIPEILVKYRIKANSMLKEAQAHHVELMAQIEKDFPQVYA